MSQAVMETTDLKAQEPVSVFVSKCPNQKLFVKQPYRHVQNGYPVFVPGESIQFENHEFRTSDPELKRFIRNHRLFGLQITEVTDGDLGRAKQKIIAPSTPTVDPDDSVQARIQEALAKNPEAKVALACPYPGCDYVALGEDETSARKSLNGHQMVKGHRHPNPEF